MSWRYEEFSNQEVDTFCPVSKFHLTSNDLLRVAVAVCINQPIGSELRAMQETYYMVAFIFGDEEIASKYEERLKSAGSTVESKMFPGGEDQIFVRGFPLSIFGYLGQYNKVQKQALFFKTTAIERIDEFINGILEILGKPLIPEEYFKNFQEKVKTDAY